MRTALITGSQGQDGKLLFELLKSKGYGVLGLDLNKTEAHGVQIPLPASTDLTISKEVIALVAQFQPDEIYHLAAVHHSSEENSSENASAFRRAYEVNFFALINLLEGVRLHSPQTHVFYAASSHIFGHSEADIQDESTPLNPDSPYAFSKVDGLQASRLYRSKYGIHASVGILYNHESEYRASKFLSKKITSAVVRINNGSNEKLTLGDLSAVIDWGYARDYVEAMHRINTLTESPESDDFIVASGTRHTVEDFVQTAFRHAGLDWRSHVVENPSWLGRRNPLRIGNPVKLMKRTGWTPSVSFEQMIKLLLISEGLPIDK